MKYFTIQVLSTQQKKKRKSLNTQNLHIFKDQEVYKNRKSEFYPFRVGSRTTNKLSEVDSSFTYISRRKEEKIFINFLNASFSVD